MAVRGEYAKGRARRERILGEAARLFAESGYRAASLRDLAARCELSPAGLLHHVGDKESLLLAVLQRCDEDDATGSDLTGGSGRDRLDALLEGVRRDQTRRGTVELRCVLSAEATSPGHPAHAHFVRRQARTVAALDAAFADCGHPRPASAARRLLAVLEGLQVQWLLRPDDVDVVSEVAQQVEVELAAR